MAGTPRLPAYPPDEPEHRPPPAALAPTSPPAPLPPTTTPPVLLSALLTIFNHPFSPFRIDLLRPPRARPADDPQPKQPSPAAPPSRKSMVRAPMSAAIAASLASGGTESVGFLNDIVKQLWDYINVAGSTMTKEIVEPMFKEMLPAPLNSLRFKKIDLGPTPIEFNNVDVLNRNEGVIKLDIDVFWDGKCDIELEANLLGSFGVEHLKLQGRVSILLCPLVERMPLVTAMQVAFVNPPKIDLDFTGLADIADFKLISDSVRKVIIQVLCGILVLPNRLLVKIDPTSKWFDTYQQPMGFLRLTVERGAGFKTPKGFLGVKDVPDVYVKTQVGALPKWKTSTKDNDVTPEWGETRDFLLSDHDQRITLEAVDDDLAADDKLGIGHMTVGELLLARRRADVPLMDDAADTGARISISCDVMQLTADLSSLSDEAHAAEGLHCGLITVLVAGAKNLPAQRREVASCVKVEFGENTMQTPVVVDMPMVDALNPAYDAVLRVPLTAEIVGAAPEVQLTLINKKKSLGSVNIAFADLIAAENGILESEYPVGDGGASLSVKVVVSGVVKAES